ncbi:MAG: hypothetical protein Q4F05_09140 [bacterium]|nr:hypothetical protein [bacterium]
MRKEWIIRLLKTLTKEEYEQVLRNAKSQGFKVDGFKDVTKVPVARLAAILNNNNKNMKLHLKMLVSIANAIIAQCEFVLEKGEENKQVVLRDKIARSALHKGTDKDVSIDKMLDELEQAKEQQAEQAVTKEQSAVKEETKEEAKTENRQLKRILESNEPQKKLEELKQQMLELTETAEKLKAKNKKLDEKIILLNMDNEDKDKTIKRLEKELNHAKVCEEREEELISLQKEFDELKSEQASLLERMKEKDSELSLVKDQLELYQEENSRKVLMFTKKKLAADHFPGYRIQIAISFGMGHRIPFEDYDEIWVITRDFAYATLQEIKRAAKKEADKDVYTFYSHKVIKTV